MEKLIYAESLTASAFSPFGQVIEGSGQEPDFRNDGGTRGWKFDFASGQPLLMLLETQPLVLRVDSLEAHSNVTQAFFPVGGAAAVLVVAPKIEGEGLPSADETRAFLLDGSVGYILDKGTWHSVDRLPIQNMSTKWLMLTDCETQGDLPLVASGDARFTREVDLEAEWGFSLRIELAS